LWIFPVITAGLILCAWPGTVPAAGIPGTGDDVGKTVVYRDTWGVPHIYAPTVEAGAYAIGWTQAEDRPEELLKNFLRATGEIASVEGAKSMKLDLAMNLWNNYEVSKQNADTIRPEVRKPQLAFVKGVNDYYEANPQDVPEWWGDRKVDEAMMIAFGRLFLYNWSIEQAFADLKRGGIEPSVPPIKHGSNQFAVSPARSAEGAAILAIDPHLSWWGLTRFWEFRIHAGEMNGSGFTIPGFPTIGLGHTDHIAWAMTTGGPDTADVYELTLNAEDPSKYLYDGEWRQLTSRDVTIEIKGAGTQEFKIYESHYGPIIAQQDGKAYAAKMAYATCVKASEAWHELNFAKDYTGLVRAAATLQLYPQNVMLADTSGNIYFERVGRVPRRPAGFDWSRPVDGSTSATEWQGFHPSSDHVQLLNPPQGYMQNCNIPPDVMLVDSPLTPDKTLPHIYGDMIYGPLNGWTNQRGARAVELLEADDSVTAEEAIAYILDVRPAGIDNWLEFLRKADTKFGTANQSDSGFAAFIEDLLAWLGMADEVDTDYAAGIKDILAWNGELRHDSTGALKYYYWRKQLYDDYWDDSMAPVLARQIDNLLAPFGKPEPELITDDDQLKAVVDSFAKAMANLRAAHGSLDAVYGDVFRVGRDDVSWPVGGGGDRDLGMRTLRNVSYVPEREDGTRWGRAGQTSTQVVVMSKPIRSWTAVPIGQSDRPDSPHYSDSAEKLFSPRKLKPTWYTPEELAEHIKSRTVLEGFKAD
jgi:acyl-homoserine lactone acylase PvdQ